jgi:hypothetical protein
MIVSLALVRRHIWKDVGKFFGRSVTPWIVCALVIYAIFGAIVFPRLFAGQTTVFIVSQQRSGYYEAPLAPVSQNITQAAYFVLGALVFFAASFALQRKNCIADIRRGYMFMATTNALLGVIDLAGKVAGMGDALRPIRTANYALLTEAIQQGFWRITGGQPEASAYAAVSLGCLAFTYSYWRKTGDRYSFWLSLLLLFLLVLSTSSTAYVGLAILCIPVGLSIIKSLFSKRLEFGQIVVISLGVCGLALILFMVIAKPDFSAPFARLMDDMLFNKLSSSSGQERAYWNYKSLQSFVDTFGLGVGIGSSRASSWPIAVLSQLGILGFVLIAALVARLVRRTRYSHATMLPEDAATLAGARNCALARIVAVSLSGGTANPSMVFLIGLAVIVAYDRAKDSAPAAHNAVRGRNPTAAFPVLAPRTMIPSRRRS